MFLNIEITDLIMVSAIILGPILAVNIQKKLEKHNERKNRQLYIFRTLMATRATPVSHDHVMALNMIDMDFRERKKKERPVLRSWRVLLDNFGKYPRIENYTNAQEEYKILLANANQKSQELLVDLLYNMSEALGYNFETIHIQNGCYVPTGHTDVEDEQTLLRKGLIQVLGGQLPLNMNVMSLPEQTPHENVVEFLNETKTRQQDLIDTLNKVISGESQISISLSDNK